MESVNTFKEHWVKKVGELKDQALSFLDTELNRIQSLRKNDPCNLDLLREQMAVEEVKEMVLNHDYTFAKSTTPKELLKSFPTILLPAPSFIELCRKLY